MQCKLSSRVLATPPTNIIRGRTLGCWGSSGRNKVDQRWMCECVCQMYASEGHVIKEAQLREKQRTERMTRQNHVRGAFGMIFRRNTYIITTPIRPWADKYISVGRTALARMPGEGSRTKVLGDFKSVSVAVMITTWLLQANGLRHVLCSALCRQTFHFGSISIVQNRVHISLSLSRQNFPDHWNYSALILVVPFRSSPCPHREPLFRCTRNYYLNLCLWCPKHILTQVIEHRVPQLVCYCQQCEP